MIEIDADKVAARFAVLAGLNTDDAEQYRTLCMDAAAELGRGERAGCGPEASGPLAAAAAALAFYRFTLLLECGGSFEAGDVKVSPGGGSASARKLWRESLAAAAPYLVDACFLFRRTSS
jgi:hypothetical protein